MKIMIMTKKKGGLKEGQVDEFLVRTFVSYNVIMCSPNVLVREIKVDDKVAGRHGNKESQTDNWFCLFGESVQLSEEHPAAEKGSCDLRSRYPKESDTIMLAKQTSSGSVAWKDQVQDLLDHMLSFEGEEESRYVEARVANRFLYADQILKDGFCLNMIKTPLCPLKILKNMQEAVRDDDIVINGLPQTKQF
ncbi:hypothetical protein F2Q69_00058418 [Brassica cretica]|uniref:Uncharacterized protein n=1 Tax=Brassica cretica TaxID=69181 RepID=A0A8S9RD10_BRACR|nr:hypothetical protein F2Q69_00058418 [Brassica cretica]